MKNRKKIIWILIFCVFIIQGCGKNSLNKEEQVNLNEKPIIAVSIVPESTFIQAICGDKVDVVTMIPSGMSPTNYEPSPEKISTFQNADIYFAIGVPTEQANIYSKINENTKLIRLDEMVEKIYEDRFFEDGGRDPHIWLSLKRVKVMLEIMTEEISLLDEENREYYEENKEIYLQKIDATNLVLEEMFAKSDDTCFIAYHPSFGYIAEEYDLMMYTLEKNGKEATPRHLQELIDLAKEKEIDTIFYQTEVNSRQSEEFAEEIGGNATSLSPLASNYLKNMENMAKKIIEGMK
jgi:zinc transport system substrate-binding protein